MATQRNFCKMPFGLHAANKTYCRCTHHDEHHRLGKKYSLNWKLFKRYDAERVLRNIIEWGRYAELFAYDDKSSELNLENQNNHEK